MIESLNTLFYSMTLAQNRKDQDQSQAYLLKLLKSGLLLRKVLRVRNSRVRSLSTQKTTLLEKNLPRRKSRNKRNYFRK